MPPIFSNTFDQTFLQGSWTNRPAGVANNFEPLADLENVPGWSFQKKYSWYDSAWLLLVISIIDMI